MDINVKVEIGVSRAVEDLVGEMMKLFGPSRDIRDDAIADAAAMLREAVLGHVATHEKPKIEPVMDECTLSALEALQGPILAKTSVFPGTEDSAMAAQPSCAVAVDLPAAAMPAPLPALSPEPDENAPKKVTFGVWTEERLKYLKTAYPRGDSKEAIFETLNHFDGNPISTPYAVQVQANKLKLCRPFPVHTADVQPAQPMQALPAKIAVVSPSPLPATPTRPQIRTMAVEWDQVLRYAKQQSINTIDGTDQEVLERVNWLRSARGLDLYALATAGEMAA